MLEVIVGHIGAPALWMFVLKLHQDDAAAAIDLVGRDDFENLLVPPVGRREEGRIVLDEGAARP